MSRFYALGLDKSSSQSKCSSIGGECRIVCLNIEDIPAYADISKIVKLRGSCEIIQSELNRWAEPIKYSIARSLSNHLGDALGSKYMLVPFAEANAAGVCEHKICVEFTNFIFDEESGKLLLSANVSISRRGKLVTVCEYADCVTVGEFAQCSEIVGGMDWALKIFGEFVARCVDGDCADGNTKVPCGTCPCPEALARDQKSEEVTAAKASQGVDVFPRIVNIVSRGEVYVVVDSEDGTKRYFSGRLFSGSSINVKCDSPYKVTSTDDKLIEVK
jgi:uncharacterized lipoprotein YmbA